VVAATGPTFAIRALAPSAGSASGGDTPTILGTGFGGGGNASGVTAALGGVAIQVRFATDTALFLVDTPPHVPGPVDVTVTNAAGQEARLNAGYTFVAPESLNFNGLWRAAEGQQGTFTFTIQNNALINLSCGSSTAVPVEPPIPISHGEITYATNDGIALSARIVSASFARGSISVGSYVVNSFFASNE
jgi:hypothetical protein